MRLNILKLTLALLTMTGLGCSADVQEKELAGTYKMQYAYGTETLKLTVDGTFVQEFALAGEKEARTASGRWRLKTKNAYLVFEDNVVLLDGAMVIDDSFGKIRSNYWEVKPGMVGLDVSKRWGKISLIMNSEQAITFERPD